ncbi:hypothetical protein NEFER03_1632 [Nematocida sp. LUAm3]|nr:hypothetical protein NEFER03_1632 [Nematocida sp. LUAm3]KAI5176108.1 hypothetical protein NEFER02_1929 [Nematocida sp. LUAm2]KAI5178996.1 hypothetical protein NEFER01_1872 [Nematocida sp. LUAm1]
MKVSELLEVEAKVSELLRKEKEKKTEKASLLTEIQRSLEERRKLLLRLEEEKRDSLLRIKKKTEALSTAKGLVSEKENEEKEGRRKELEKEYQKAIEEANSIEFQLSKDMKKAVLTIKNSIDLAKKKQFINLACAIEKHLLEKIKEYSVEIKHLSSSLRADKLIIMITALSDSLFLMDSSISSAETRRSFFVGVYFDSLYEAFSYHFLSDFRTNRLDKPEWYCEYLLKEIESHDKIFNILAQVDHMDEEDVEADKEQLKKKYFDQLLEIINLKILSEKFKEPILSSSKQRLSLILYHSQEIGVFLKELKKRYIYAGTLQIPESLIEEVYSSFLSEANTRLEKELSKPYTEWPESLRSIIKQVFSEAVALYPTIPNIHNRLIISIINKYFTVLSVFLNTFCYISEEETKILFFFLEEVFYVEEELLDIENEFGVSVGEVVLFDLSSFNTFKSSFFQLFDEILKERVENHLKHLCSYRFFEENEEEEFLSDFSSSISYFLKNFSNNSIITHLKEKLLTLSDDYIANHVITEQLDGISDLDRIKNILSLILDIFKEHNISTSLPKSMKKSQDISAKYHSA